MIWFLRLFSHYRELESQVQKLMGYVAEADDKARLWRLKCETAEHSRDTIRVEFINSLKQTANFEAIRGGGQAVPYPDVITTSDSSQESHSDAQVGSHFKRSAREAQQEAVMQARKIAHERRVAMNGQDQ